MSQMADHFDSFDPAKSTDAWAIRLIFGCDGCGAGVVCLFDGAQRWLSGAVKVGLDIFCAACADHPQEDDRV